MSVYRWGGCMSDCYQVFLFLILKMEFQGDFFKIRALKF